MRHISIIRDGGGEVWHQVVVFYMRVEGLLREWTSDGVSSHEDIY